MKKIFAILLAVTMLASMATVVSAAESTTTLSTTVPAATYTLNIPADQEIEFGSSGVIIGNVTITESANFAEGKNVEVFAFNKCNFDNVDTFSFWSGASSCHHLTSRHKHLLVTAISFVQDHNIEIL